MMRLRTAFVLASSSAALAIGACYEPYAAEEEPIHEVARTTPDTPEAGPSMPVSRDASRDGRELPRRCDPQMAFGIATQVNGVNSGELDSDGRLSADETTLYFTSERGTQPSPRNRVWKATRLGSGWDFAAPTLVLDEASFDLYDPTLSPDERTLVVQHTSTNGTEARLHHATRATTTDPFIAFTELPGLHVPGANERDPSFAADGTLLFTRQHADGGVQIGRARSDGGTWNATFFDELASPGANRNAVLSADGLEIFFSSDRVAAGKARIFRAERPSIDAPFGPALEVAELAGTSGYDVPNWLSADRCVLVFTSDRDGDLDIYYAVRGD